MSAYREIFRRHRPLLHAVFATALTSLSAVASAERFCYYWVDQGGNADTFETPPIDMSSPPFPETGSLNGHLVVALTRDSCRRSQFRSIATEPRPGAQPRTPISAPGAEIAPGQLPEEEDPSG